MKHLDLEAPFVLFETPPFCPNPECRWHNPENAAEARFAKRGSRPVKRFPYVTRRFFCTQCRIPFSDSIFYLFYRDRTEPTYEQIFHYHCNGQSRRSLARDLGCSSSTVQRRFRKLSSQSLLQQAWRSRNLQVKESVAMDGLENFAYSQFDPNNINHVVGRESYYLYDFNFSPLNRKGRRTDAQKKREAELEKEFGRYPTNAIRTATRRLLERMLKNSTGQVELHTDQHYAYREAIELLPEKHRLEHFITPSRVARNFRNRLFAINHADLLSRQQLTTFKRETIAFAKHSIGMIESFALLVARKNFMAPVFTKAQKRDPRAHLDSPAMRVGIETKVLSFKEFFGLRLTKTQVALSGDWRDFIERRAPTSRRPIAAA